MQNLRSRPGAANRGAGGSPPGRTTKEREKRNDALQTPDADSERRGLRPRMRLRSARSGDGQCRLYRPSERWCGALRPQHARGPRNGREGNQRRRRLRGRGQEIQVQHRGARRQVLAERSRREREAPQGPEQRAHGADAPFRRRVRHPGLQRAGQFHPRRLYERADHRREGQQADPSYSAVLPRLHRAVHQRADEDLRQEARHGSRRPRLREGLVGALRAGVEEGRRRGRRREPDVLQQGHGLLLRRQPRRRGEARRHVHRRRVRADRSRREDRPASSASRAASRSWTRRRSTRWR